MLQQHEAMAHRAARGREEALERLKVCATKLQASYGAKHGVMFPNDPIAKLFYRSAPCCACVKPTTCSLLQHSRRNRFVALVLCCRSCKKGPPIPCLL